MFDKIYPLADSIVLSCCNLKRYEKLLVVCDWTSFELGRAFHCAAQKRCKESMLIMIAPERFDDASAEPNADFLKKFDVIIIAAAPQVTHSSVRQSAVQNGSRIIYILNIVPDNFLQILDIDWRMLNVRTRRIVTRMTSSQQIHITTPAGTDISFQIHPETVTGFDGKIGLRGSFGYLPAGFACGIPVEGTANGKLVVDGTCSHVNNLQNQPLIINIKDGEIVSFEEHPESKTLQNHFIKGNTELRVLHEFSVGTSEKTQLQGNCTFDRITHGTLSFFFGNTQPKNSGRNEPSVFKVLFRNATAFVDGRIWFKDGLLD